jgi:flagellar export protein FliJ
VAFRFTLASVLRVRESIERREELALQKAEHEIVRVQRRIDQLVEELEKAAAARAKALEQPTPAYRLGHLQSEINAALETKQSLLDHLATLEQQRDWQRKRFQEAHKGRKMLTEMRDQQQDAFEQEETRAQQKQLDDIFVSRRQRG